MLRRFLSRGTMVPLPGVMDVGSLAASHNPRQTHHRRVVSSHGHGHAGVRKPSLLALVPGG